MESYLGADGLSEKDSIASIWDKAGDSISQFGDNVWNRMATVARSKRANIKTNELSNLDKVQIQIEL